MKSRKFIITLIIQLLFIGLIFQSCSDITEMQREYLDRGKILYVGKIDSVKMRGGLHRVQMQGLLSYARSAVLCQISWDDQVREYPLETISLGDTAHVLIEGLKEGSYRFFIQTFDKDGNKSLKEECQGYVYGDNYLLSQGKKMISKIVATPEKAIIYWSVEEDAYTITVSYKSKENGKIKTLLLPGNVVTTEIPDWIAGGEITVKTTTLPEKDAYDLIDLTPLMFNFPLEMEVSKSNFKVVKLPTDIPGNAHGGLIEKIWDGDLSSMGYHSIESDGVPHHFTFDLGVLANLTSFEMAFRQDFLGWNPVHLQIWGIESLDGAETTLASAHPEWENEAKAKGWKLIADKHNSKEPFIVKHTVDINAGMIRYIRYRVLEVGGYQGNTVGFQVCSGIQELTLRANQVKNIE